MSELIATSVIIPLFDIYKNVYNLSDMITEMIPVRVSGLGFIIRIKAWIIKVNGLFHLN